MNKPLKYGIFLFIVIFFIDLVITLAFSVFILGEPFTLLKYLLTTLVSAIIVALLISFLVVFTSPLFKDFLTTWRTLLRLESLSHPLLIRLSSETPGTYNHSLNVANLAHRAAKSIGADSLLARVGGYYHDIGKLSYPQSFIENQTDFENLHEELSPKESTKIIINHVKEGIKIAKEYKLPKEVINLIAEHHGTTLISFFYQKALEKSPRSKGNDYRYPGPKPMTLEGVIIMLADAIEAKIRLEKNVTPTIINQTVDEIVKQRLDDGQLELSGINAVKLSRIRTAFIEALKVIFHQRISYPTIDNRILPKRPNSVII